MTTLPVFLSSHRVAKGEKTWNVTGLGKNDKGIYNIPSSEYDTFLSLYYKYVFEERKVSGLLERHHTYSPILIDLDFRYSSDTKDRCFDESHVTQWLKIYSTAFYQFFDYKEPLRFFVMFRPEMTREEDIVKDGIHIVCGDLSLPIPILKTLRKYTLEKRIMEMFADRSNLDDDAFDEAVIERNNWFLYGAGKQDKPVYCVDYCFLCYPDGRIESVDWDEDDKMFIRLFSLQCERDIPTSLTIRPELRDEWNTWESIALENRAAKSKKAIVEIVHVNPGIDDGASTCSHLSEGICKILKNSAFNWNVEEYEEGYKLVHDQKDCLIVENVKHGMNGHSCIFVQKTHAIMSCFSHKTKAIPRTKASLLWKLLTNEKDEKNLAQSAYEERKRIFEERNFRVLKPPGYMTCIDNSWIHYTRQQLIDMNSGIFLDDEKKERFIDWWLKDEKIRTYSQIGYFVDKWDCPSTVFNTFRGFAGSYSESAECTLDHILYHLRSVISNNDSDVYEFILDWLSAVIQSPRKLNGVCLIVMGQHGAGKDILFNWFGSKVVGMESYYKTARPHIDMFGSFNASRLNRVFYHIEEGNSKSFTGEYVEQFKNCITDEFASIQLKGRDTFANEINYNHYVVSSNNSVPFDIHRDERRFFAVRASNKYVRDNSYFNTLGESLKSPGTVRAFYDLLMTRDISARDWKNPPSTEALKEWKHSCESGVSVFLEHYKTINPEVHEIKSSELFASYTTFCREYRQAALKLRQFGIEAKRLLGDPGHKETGNYYDLKNVIASMP
jgi:hypothetical protein